MHQEDFSRMGEFDLNDNEEEDIINGTYFVVSEDERAMYLAIQTSQTGLW